MIDRVMIIGCCGAGKSTITGALARHYDLPIVHLDHVFWRPGWNRVPAGEWEATVDSLTAADRWIHDGNYGSTLARRAPRADLVVLIDTPRWRCFWRVIKRRLRGGENIPGCHERITWGLLKYIWQYRKHHQPKNLADIDQHSDASLIRLSSGRDISRYLARLDDPANLRRAYETKPSAGDDGSAPAT